MYPEKTNNKQQSERVSCPINYVISCQKNPYDNNQIEVAIVFAC